MATVEYDSLAYGLSTAEMRYFWSQYLGLAAEASDPEASPLRARSLAGVAPAVIVTAEYDILRDEAETVRCALALRRRPGNLLARTRDASRLSQLSGRLFRRGGDL
jgi:acetyl esterase/lipase